MQNQPNVFREIPVDKIVEGKNQVRRFYNAIKLDELRHSLADTGMLQQVVVRPTKKQKFFELIIGSRRLRVARRLKLETISARVIEGVDDKSAIIMALTENIHRDSLTPFEEARAFLKLIKDFKMTQQDVAKHLGRGETFVRNRIKLLSLPTEVQEMVSRKEIAINQVNILANLPSSREQVRFAKVAKRHHLKEEHLTLRIRKEAQKQKKVTLDTSRWTGTKVALEIEVFAQFLREITSHVTRMKGGDIFDVRQSLEQCRRDLMKAIQTFEQVVEAQEKSA